MNVIGHNFEFDKFDMKFRTHRGNNLSKSNIDTLHKNLAPVFRTPDDMKLTRIYDIMSRFIFHGAYYT